MDLPDPRSKGLDGMEIGKVLGKIADSTIDHGCIWNIFFLYGGRWRRVKDETFEGSLNSLLKEIIQI